MTSHSASNKHRGTAYAGNGGPGAHLADAGVSLHNAYQSLKTTDPDLAMEIEDIRTRVSHAKRKLLKAKGKA